MSRRPGAATCVTPPPGMVAWWPGEGNANDIRGENNGTLQGGVTFAAGEVGQAFGLDGASQFLLVPDAPSLNPTSQMTLDAWVFPTANAGTGDVVSMIMNKEVTSSSQVQYEIGRRNTNTCPSGGGIPTGNFAFALGGISGLPNDCDGWVDGGAQLPLNTWSHVALTFNGTNVNSYVNGSLARQITPVSGTLTVANGSFRIGARSGSLAFWAGVIDEPELFKRGLTQTEVQNIVNAGSAGKCKPRCTPPPSGLVGWWTGDDNPFDIFGTNHGALQNGATFVGGKVGRAFSLDGINDFVSVPDSPLWDFGSNDFTIDLWVNFNQIKNSMFVHQLSGSVPGGWEFNFQTGPNQLFFNIDPATTGISRPWSPEISTWYHVGVTSGTYRLYDVR